MNNEDPASSYPLIENTALVNNLSSHRFTETELQLLEKGLNYAIQPARPPIDEIIADVETGIWNLQEESKEAIRLEVKNVIHRNNVVKLKNQTKLTYKTINELKNKSCYYMKADKGNGLVILDKEEYRKRVDKLIEEGPYTKLNKNPLPKMEADVNQVLKKFEQQFDEPHWRLKLKISNARTPRLYALPKIHKPGEQMRPICSNINAPCSGISKWLIKEFSKLNEPVGKYIKNNLEFVSKLKEVRIDDDEILVSFDVQALFPNVPIDETILYLKEWLNEQDIEDSKVEAYIELAEVCMKQNIFSFNNEWYRQTDGVAMGNSLSPFLANLFMCYFEENLSKDPDFPRVWIRYVDDVFAVQKKDKIDDTLELLNNNFRTIKFTYEKENNGRLPFLDLWVIRNNGLIEFDIYRKPTNTPRFICDDSFHSFQHKYSAFNALIHRMYSIPLKKDRVKVEERYILSLAKFNGLKEKLILKMMEKKKWKSFLEKETTLQNIEEKVNKKHIKLMFYPKITNKLSTILSKHGLKAAVSSKTKLKHILGTTKDKIDKMDKSGIYEIKCEKCSARYIGMTKRKLRQRLRDHQLDIKNCTEKTALAKHIKYENTILGKDKRKQKKHGINEESITLLKEAYGYRELCVWESIYINKNRSSALNDNNGAVDSTLTRMCMTKRIAPADVNK